MINLTCSTPTNTMVSVGLDLFRDPKLRFLRFSVLLPQHIGVHCAMQNIPEMNILHIAPDVRSFCGVRRDPLENIIEGISLFVQFPILEAHIMLRNTNLVI